MKNLLSTLLLLLLFTLSSLHAQSGRDITLSSGKRLAAVVGVSAYQSVPPLKNTLNDADSVVAALRFLGFEVMTLRNPDDEQMEIFLENYYQKLVKGGYEAALFYYSGHGISVFGNNYLVPVNARPLSERDVKFQCLDANRVLATMEGHAPVKILILDACRDNPFARSWATRSATANGLSFMTSPEGTFIGFAAAPGEKASDGRRGSNGLYTSALLQHLRTPGLSIDQIFTRVAATTRDLASGENWTQIPFKNSSLTADFYFRHGQAPPPPVVVPDPVVPKPSPSPTPVPNHMVRIEGGWFEMGDTFGEGDSDEKPVHRVGVSPFLMGKNEVTFREYDAFCEATGRTKPDDRGWGRDNRPVINVSWLDAVEYCNWRSRQENLRPVYTINGESVSADWSANGYRLPTEAEWEYAARQGGQKVRFGNGQDVANPAQINFDGNWYPTSYSIEGLDRQKTIPVGSLNSPNSFGLHDMSGNVWEWCWDWYGDSYYGSSPGEDPKGPSSGSNRVLRGGSWVIYPADVRAAYRNYRTPSYRFSSIGFRLSRTLY